MEWDAEVAGCRAALSRWAAIPVSHIVGFRAPNLLYTSTAMATLHHHKFLYDSSIPERVVSCLFPGVLLPCLTCVDALRLMCVLENVGTWMAVQNEHVSPSPAQRVWPYTLDHGSPQACGAQSCQDWRFPGLWEVPMCVTTRIVFYNSASNGHMGQRVDCHHMVCALCVVWCWLMERAGTRLTTLTPINPSLPWIHLTLTRFVRTS